MHDTLATRFSQSLVLAAGSKSGRPCCLVRIHPEQGLGELIELTEEVVTIGRDAGCDLQLRDDSVSRRHAEIVVSPEGCTIRDLGSTNALYINDERAVERRLSPGDRVRLGNQIFRFLGADGIEAEYHEAVYRMMTTDGLTQTFNKRYLLDVAQRELLRARRTGEPLCVLLFDIDHFKAINDTYGHLAGDEVLSGLCRRVKTTLRGDEVFARYGGEEFTILLAHTPQEQAHMLAERLRQAVAESPFETESATIAATISIGLAETRGQDSLTTSQLLALADEQLYMAKQSGRNRVMG